MDYHRRPESVDFTCPYCEQPIRLAERRSAVPVTPAGSKHMRYAHGSCKDAYGEPQLTVIQGGRP